MSKKLATIVTDAPIEIDFEKMVIDNWNEDALLTLFSEMEFRTLAKRVLGADISNTAQKASIHPTNASGQLDLFASTEDVIDTDEQLSEGEIKTINDVEHDYHLVESETEIKRLIELLDQTESFCFDTETTGLDALTAEVVGLAFSWQEHTGYYVYIKEGNEQQVLDLFKPVFANEKIGKVAQNIKYDINVLVKYGVEVRGKLLILCLLIICCSRI